MQYRVKVEWENEDGGLETAELGQVETGPCLTESDVGLKLVAAKEIMARLQAVVTTQQLQRHCEAARCCPSCQAPRNVKDYRTRTLDTVLGRLVLDAPRFDSCRACGQRGVKSPLTQLLTSRVLPELRHLQAKFAADLPYRRAAELLRELLPQTGGITAVTTRNRTLAIGMAIEAELCREVEHPQTPQNQADHLTVGIDGAFVKAKRKGKQGRQHFEILTGRIEQTRGRGEAFAIVRDLDGRAKQKVQAVLRRAGRTAETAITVLSDGEDGLRGVVGWFGRKCEHRLDWFHVSRRLDRIHKLLLYLPDSPIYGSRLAFHSRNLNRIKYQLWNSGIEMADWGMRIFRAGLAEDAWDSPQELKRFQYVESQLDELRSYLYSNETAVHDYAKTFREGGRVSSAHVESTVNQLINWRFCKKQQMCWTRTGAQGLLHVRTALINGTLSHYSVQQPLSQAA
jgi:hypothetical protein